MIRLVFIIAVKETNPRTGGVINALVTCSAAFGIVLKDIFDSRVVKAFYDILCVVGGTIVDDDQFPILIRLLNYTSDASRQKRSSIVGWKNNGKEWLTHVGYPKIVHFKW